MCIGVPMRVVEAGPGFALCEGGGRRREVDMALVGDQTPGTWVLVFIDAAREVLSDDQARKITDALTALTIALNAGTGEDLTTDIDALFPDLANREPELPDFLRAQAARD